VDAVVHLAARVHRDRDDSVGPGTGAAYFHTNTAGTARLARAAAEAGVKRLVFLSTLKVNGEDRAEACRESDPEAPCGPYAVSKYEAENVLREISARTGLQTVILRPPLVYGPGVKANFLSLLKIVDRGIPLPLASVANRRSLIFIDNIVDAVLICLSHPNAAGKTYLIADTEYVSTPELIKKLAFHLGVQPRLIRCPIWMLRFAGRLTRQKEAVAKMTSSLWADTSKIDHEIGWSPSYRLSDGLKKTADWYRSEFHASFR
jgi:nucleoside-diphosphate-sugar epimerase